jgi:hypothetical protein
MHVCCVRVPVTKLKDKKMSASFSINLSKHTENQFILVTFSCQNLGIRYASDKLLQVVEPNRKKATTIRILLDLMKLLPLEQQSPKAHCIIIIIIIIIIL